MTRFTADQSAVLTRAFTQLSAPRLVNPAWLALLNGPARAAADREPGQQRLVQRALIAPVVAALSVTCDGVSEHLRIALDHEGAILVATREGKVDEWMESAIQDIPGVVDALLTEGARLSAVPRMTARCDGSALRLSPVQRRAIAERIGQGLSARDAIAAQADLSEDLRDALLSDGARAAFDITMSFPAASGEPAVPFRLLRRWNVGTRGLYATDGRQGISHAIHRVADGDVLATVLPLLREGAALARGEDAAG